MEQKNNFPIHTCADTDSLFPKTLRRIPHAPHTVYYRGSFSSTSRIAIVGTRKASLEGKKLAHHVAYELALQQWTIVSGLAFGIDAAAHQGACDANGISWAVLAHGLDSIQPKQHVPLAQKILELNGCLISEYPFGTPPYPHQFLARNRIISGLSTAVIVIEAPRTSGSLATAHAAAQQGIPVFVFPGPATSPLFAGSHELLRHGARLVRSVRDIYEDLNAHPTLSFNSHVVSQTPLSTQQNDIFLCIKETAAPISLETILEKTGLPYPQVQKNISKLIEEQKIIEIGPQLYNTSP